jgi:hypothetical protein
MNALRLSAKALGLYAIVSLLTACGGTNTAMNGAVPSGLTAQARTHKASGSYGGLLYVVTSDATDVLDYPGYESTGTLNPNGFLGFPCSGPNDGDVFLDSGSEVRQYSYGASNPINTIFLKRSDFGYGCAVDPTTNDLTLTGQHRGKGAVFVYQSVSGEPKVISDSNSYVFYYCGYDNNGNLFADGLTKNNTFAFAELPKGSDGFTDITVSAKVKSPGNVQFDGTYITVRSALTIYQLQISGDSGAIVGSTTLNQLSSSVASTWIQGDIAIGAQGGGNHPGHGLGFWHYPQGGKPFMVLTTLSKNRKDVIVGTTVSVAPSRFRRK